MRNFLTLYTRMTHCCCIFSLQAGVVIIGVLGVVWTASSMLINLFRPYESTLTGFTVLQYIVAYLVLILICGGHVWNILAGSWAHPNLILMGFVYNTGILILWILLSILSYVNSPGLIAVICIEGRCPDVLWLFDAYWRDTGVKCAAGTGDANMLLATREIFSIAPMLGYVSHWPDYIDQPGLGVPCYDNIPDTVNYVSYLDSGNTSSCPRADWLSWKKDVNNFRKEAYEYYYDKQKKIPVTKPPIPIYPHRPKRSINKEDYNDDSDDDNSALNRTFLNNYITLNNQTLFDQFLQQGCEHNHPRFIVVSSAFLLFFACFFLYGRAVEFNYFNELVIPLRLTQGRFEPPGSVLVIDI